MSNFASLRTPHVFVQFSQMCLCYFCRFFPVGFGWLGLTFCQNFLVFLPSLFSYFFVIPAQFLSCHMICGFCAFVPRGFLRCSQQALICNTLKKRMQTNLHPLKQNKSPAGIRRDGQRPKGGQRGQTCGTLPRPRKQPTGLICAPLRRGRAVRVLPSFATKTEKSRRDTAGLLFWWRMGDSNPRPLRCERSALTS